MTIANNASVGLSRSLRALIIEDTPTDLKLLLIELEKAGYATEYECVDTEEDLLSALHSKRWDIVLSDYTLPEFSGIAALQQVKAFDPDLPFIIISGTIGEETAVSAMQAGAQDYLLKDNLVRLGATIDRQLQDAQTRRERRRADEQLHETKRRLQALSNRMLEVQEAERRQIARELHDEIGQSLTAIKLTLQTLERKLPDGESRDLVSDVSMLTGTVLNQVRALSLDLRPPQLDDLGLIPALNWLIKRYSNIPDTTVELIPPAHSSQLPDRRLSPQIETASFRVAQEALTNAIRHAGATHVCISLSYQNNECRLEIADDGRGFNLSDAHQHAIKGNSLGLISMQERISLAGGRFLLSSTPEQGTIVQACFPLSFSEEPS